jgi:hypothetical protein
MIQVTMQIAAIAAAIITCCLDAQEREDHDERRSWLKGRLHKPKRGDQ